ncbi:MAG: molybdenum cofactor guanylyltransferase [Gemmatimonadaceae bacterium]
MATDRVTGLLLAGGQSKRMGRDKRLLAIGEETMVARSYRVLQEAFGQPWVLVADERDVELLAPILGPTPRFLVDLQPGSGPLLALSDALGEIDGSHAFLLAADMPRVTSAFLRDFDRLRRGLTCGSEALVPRSDGFAQVTCAFYKRSLAPALRATVHADGMSLVEWLGRPGINVRYLGDDELRALGGRDMFENLNTPYDHTRYLKGRQHDR